jgi:hypothetical protein
MNRTIRLGMLMLAGVLSLIATSKVLSASCINNNNSHLAEIEGIATCAGTGDGCSVCFTREPRGAGSWNLCYFDYHTSDLACTYYN